MMDWNAIKAQVAAWDEALAAGTVPEEVAWAVAEAHRISKFAVAGLALAEIMPELLDTMEEMDRALQAEFGGGLVAGRLGADARAALGAWEAVDRDE